MNLFACIYGLSLAVSLLCLRIPLTSRLSGQGFATSVRYLALVELISLNLSMLVLLPLCMLPYSRFPLLKPSIWSDFTTWLFFLNPMLPALFATMLAPYPIQAWLTYYGWAA